MVGPKIDPNILQSFLQGLPKRAPCFGNLPNHFGNHWSRLLGLDLTTPQALGSSRQPGRPWNLGFVRVAVRALEGNRDLGLQQWK